MTKQELYDDVVRLYGEGFGILRKEVEEKETGKKDDSFALEADYQSWFSRACPVVRHVLPDRYAEFVELYQLEKRKQIDFSTYTIKDYLLGLTVTDRSFGMEVVNPLSAFLSKYQQQLCILHSALPRLNSRLSDIEGVLQAEACLGTNLKRQKNCWTRNTFDLAEFLPE